MSNLNQFPDQRPPFTFDIPNPRGLQDKPHTTGETLTERLKSVQDDLDVILGKADTSALLGMADSSGKEVALTAPTPPAPTPLSQPRESFAQRYPFVAEIGIAAIGVGVYFAATRIDEHFKDQERIQTVCEAARIPGVALQPSGSRNGYDGYDPAVHSDTEGMHIAANAIRPLGDVRVLATNDGRGNFGITNSKDAQAKAIELFGCSEGSNEVAVVVSKNPHTGYLAYEGDAFEHVSGSEVDQINGLISDYLRVYPNTSPYDVAASALIEFRRAALSEERAWYQDIGDTAGKGVANVVGSLENLDVDLPSGIISYGGGALAALGMGVIAESRRRRRNWYEYEAAEGIETCTATTIGDYRKGANAVSNFYEKKLSEREKQTVFSNSRFGFNDNLDPIRDVYSDLEYAHTKAFGIPTIVQRSFGQSLRQRLLPSDRDIEDARELYFRRFTDVLEAQQELREGLTAIDDELDRLSKLHGNVEQLKADVIARINQFDRQVQNNEDVLVRDEIALKRQFLLGYQHLEVGNTMSAALIFNSILESTDDLPVSQSPESESDN